MLDVSLNQATWRSMLIIRVPLVFSEFSQVARLRDGGVDLRLGHPFR